MICYSHFACDIWCAYYSTTLQLKECIRALDQEHTHTPFRQSKLTQVKLYMSFEFWFTHVFLLPFIYSFSRASTASKAWCSLEWGRGEGEGRGQREGGRSHIPSRSSQSWRRKGHPRAGIPALRSSQAPCGAAVVTSFLLISNVKKPCWFSGVSEPLKGMVVQLYLVLS